MRNWILALALAALCSPATASLVEYQSTLIYVYDQGGLLGTGQSNFVINSEAKALESFSLRSPFFDLSLTTATRPLNCKPPNNGPGVCGSGMVSLEITDHSSPANSGVIEGSAVFEVWPPNDEDPFNWFISQPHDFLFYWYLGFGNVGPKYSLELYAHKVETSEEPATVPEPTTLALLGLGLAGFSACRRTGMRKPS